MITLQRIKHRAASVAMMHVALRSKYWHWRDVWFVLTGRV